MATSKNVILKDNENNTLFPQIAEASVTTNKLADGSVTKAKLADDISLASVTNTTWYELKSLRDTGKLTPGMQYRITDYQCTTKQENTQSAGHQFDIIVTADSAGKLNEKARACLHDGDTYFKDCNLAAWGLWYSLDNDTKRFAWADDDASVIKVASGSFTYYLYKAGKTCVLKYKKSTIGSNHNIVYVDATENVEVYHSYALNNNDLYMYVEDASSYSDFNFFVEDNTIYKLNSNSDGTYTLGTSLGTASTGTKEELLAAYPNATVNEKGRGVIYRMIDEWHNDCPYDFKNIQMLSNGDWVYTFVYYAAFIHNHKVNIADDSCHSVAPSKTAHNVIKGKLERITKSGITIGYRLIIPFVLFELSCSGNFIGSNSTNISFGNECCNNYVANGICYIIFGNLFEHIHVFASYNLKDKPLVINNYCTVDSDKPSDNYKFIGYNSEGDIVGAALPAKVESLPKLVSTTESAYTALATKDSNTLYCIPEE